MNGARGILRLATRTTATPHQPPTHDPNDTSRGHKIYFALYHCISFSSSLLNILASTTYTHLSLNNISTQHNNHHYHCKLA